ncbi:MAG: hypothetical protein ACI4TK_05140 [Agathobacter sp.]
MENSLKFLAELDAETLKAELLAFLDEEDIEINDMSDFIFEFEEYIKDDFSYGDCE